MSDISLHQVLTLLLWLGVSVFVLFLALIAQFYERLSGQRTYYRWFALPVVTFGAAWLRFAEVDRFAGDRVGDLLLFVAGISLGALCWHVYRLMTGGR